MRLRRDPPSECEENGQLLANGGEGFASKGNVLRSIKAVRKVVAKAGEPEEVEG